MNLSQPQLFFLCKANSVEISDIKKLRAEANAKSFRKYFNKFSTNWSLQQHHRLNGEHEAIFKALKFCCSA